MPGIFVTRGSSLRIPAGGLVLPLDGSAPPPVEVELLLELWDRWLEIAGGQTVAAEAAHRQLLEEIGTGDAGRGRALETEFNAALLATATSAFAVDAFYAAVSERVPRHPQAEVWAKNRTPREKRIVEVLKHVRVGAGAPRADCHVPQGALYLARPSRTSACEVPASELPR